MEEYKHSIWTIPVTEFKKRGYEFLKMYARNYKCYHKKVNGYDFWVWVKGKEFYIKDWFHNTENVINFYMNNVERQRAENKGKKSFSGGDLTFMPLILNDVTGEVRFFDYTKDFPNNNPDQRTLYLDTESFMDVVKEFQYLSKKV